MKQARLVLSDAAVADIVEQADWYIAQSGQALAERWEKAVTSAILRVVKNPVAGAPCKFRPAELRNVRRTTIRGFPKHLHVLQNSRDGNPGSPSRPRRPRLGEAAVR